MDTLIPGNCHMIFIDTATIEVAAGGGGNGCVSFRREKFVSRGGPDGGSGGNGGDVSLVGDSRLSTLQDFRYRRHYRAKRGEHGRGANRHGKNGESVTLRVPCGTVVFDDETGDLIADVVHPGERVVVAKAGHGGRGNSVFATPTRQTPDFAEPGKPGGRRRLRLELKLLADVGIVGLPNAGKSTLLAALSAVRPKIADYPFTTLVPNLGVVTLDQYRTCVMADIPGLIEGAAEGKGLGDQFLRHVERTRALIFLVECTSGNPEADLVLLREELRLYDGALLDKPWMLVLSKADLFPPGEVPKVPTSEGASASFAVSAVSGRGLDRLRRELLALLDEAPDPRGQGQERSREQTPRPLHLEDPNRHG